MVKKGNPTLAKDIINPFEKILCPKGGWRRHCGDKCLYRHNDDNHEKFELNEAQNTKTMRQKRNQIEGIVNLSPRKKVQRALEMEEGNAREDGYFITGMENIDGNSCYINSAIQSLVSLQPFKYEFLKNKPLYSKRLSYELWKTMTDLTAGEVNYIVANKLLEQIKKTTEGKFGNGQQQDVHEFITMTLEKLENEEIEELAVGESNKTGKLVSKEEKKKMAKSTLVHKVFYGMKQESIVCEACKLGNSKEEEFNCLALDIPPQEENVSVRWTYKSSSKIG